MKAQLFSMALAVLASTAYAEAKQDSRTIYNEAAQELSQALNVKADQDGDRFFSTSDGSLQIACYQGLLASCSFTGAFQDNSLFIYDEAAAELIRVLGLEPDRSGNFYFETLDGSLDIECHSGLRLSCALIVAGISGNQD